MTFHSHDWVSLGSFCGIVREVFVSDSSSDTLAGQCATPRRASSRQEPRVDTWRAFRWGPAVQEIAPFRAVYALLDHYSDIKHIQVVTGLLTLTSLLPDRQAIRQAMCGQAGGKARRQGRRSETHLVYARDVAARTLNIGLPWRTLIYPEAWYWNDYKGTKQTHCKDISSPESLGTCSRKRSREDN